MKYSYLKASFVLGGLVILGACSQQAYYTGGAEIERNVVQMIRVAHPVFAESDGSIALSDENIANLENFVATNTIGYGDVVLFDQGSNVSDERLTLLKNWFQTRGVMLGETGIFGSEPAEGSIKVYVEKTTVTTPDCQQWAEDSVRNPNNAPGKPFGCSTQSNLAAMVANPRDLVTGSRSTTDPQAAVNAVRMRHDTNGGKRNE